MSKEQDRKYRVTLTEDQLRIISNCLESESRMLCGQLNHSCIFAFRNLSLTKSSEDMNLVNSKLFEIKSILFPELEQNMSHGLGHQKLPDLMYDMYKSIRKELKRVQDEENISNGKKVYSNVDDHGPMGLTDRPILIVEHLSQEVIRDENINKIIK